jgi:hypothetical protein
MSGNIEAQIAWRRALGLDGLMQAAAFLRAERDANNRRLDSISYNNHRTTRAATQIHPPTSRENNAEKAGGGTPALLCALKKLAEQIFQIPP